MVGLLEAVEGYDPARGTKFETYAVFKIRHAVLEGLRKEDPCRRRLRSFARENDRAATELTQGLGRHPTEAEMTQKLGTSIKRYRNLLEQYSRTRVASAGNRTEKEYGPDVVADVVADRDAFDPHTQAERTELREGLVEALAALEEKERVVVTLYFYEGLKLKEIGRVLGLSEGRISQILSGALCKLRGSLSGGASLSLAS
jgi:RNA polymerase sigma factor for flagellar operon FliA